MKLHDIHVRSLETSTRLTRYVMPEAVTPLDVIRALNGAKINFLLVGAHGLGGWMKKPRATEDVDVMVAARQHKKAIKALQAKFRHLEIEEHEVVTRFRDRESQQVQIDVMRPNQSLYRHAFKHTRRVQSGDQVYQLPSLELALAMKFAAMVSPNRGDTKKLLDAHDFRRMVEVNEEIDLAQLTKLAELVYAGGGKEVLEMVRQVRAGEKLIL
jgi:Nucleotidyl transferase AbiEii toxin, Type IV TA system